MNNVEIKVTSRHGMHEVVGYVNGRECASASNNINNTWGFTSSQTIPWDLDRAEAVIKCISKVLKKVHKIQKEGLYEDR